MTDLRPPRRDDYAPYHTLDAFAHGVADHYSGQHSNPYEGYAPLCAQAWDRGAEYARRVERYVDCQ